jgi:hypothetical protein
MKSPGCIAAFLVIGSIQDRVVEQVPHVRIPAAFYVDTRAALHKEFQQFRLIASLKNCSPIFSTRVHIDRSGIKNRGESYTAPLALIVGN